ncbi:NAC domain-containing protein 78-like [Lycium barbarum]|uniref:NAC domain-containing protein 78-like n=1 Tax=Lycium barbarum TaxID=112863 RepID=UPI00293E1E3A|nr:NAC domain-containing protein 78-like [Lycium barbarum]
MSRLRKGVRFQPTEVELINYLKRFLRGQSLPSLYPIRLADIYGDQPPSVILGEEKVGYFISLLKKRKNSDERFRRTCANGTWTGQTSGIPIDNRKGTVMGFRRNLKYTSKEKKQKSTTSWLMREYFVGDDFFRKNDIPKQDFVVCRIKKIIKEKKVKDVAVTQQDVAGVFEAMLHKSDDDYNTTQVTTICQAEYKIMDETQKTNKKEHNSNFTDCFEEIDWADDLLINIDDFGDII